MSRSVRPLSVLLLLLPWALADILNTTEIVRNQGQDVEIRFKLSENKTVRSANLVKNSTKIDESPKNAAMDRRRNFTMAAHEAILRITNLTAEDTGVYHVDFFIGGGDYIKSKEHILIIRPKEKIREPTTTSNYIDSVLSESPPSGTPPGSPVYISIIIGFVVSIMFLTAVLLGWLYFTHNQGRDCHVPQAPSSMCQVNGEECSSVEYGVLDFQNRPASREKDRDRDSAPVRQSQDSVEYSTITFFQGLHGQSSMLGK
ncbi:hypothetical protein JZ751_014377 [Albula glossodonta]|uniref:Uncharacterized protein n=1 Tax=Albula glossodonta TaxID=121402 RepID=A0A8T2NV52_9TELE|nr:hypothetical protein JZ751_014376 [Albula glossodonta]KAG9343396.1 hypothetical protein JZ751_014377 [Albula glossodonta]